MRLVGAFVVSVTLALSCGGRSDGSLAHVGDPAGTGASLATGGASVTGGSPERGGASEIGGASGAAGAPETGGAGASGAGGTNSTPQSECQGIRVARACPEDGVECTGLRCGLADTGRRRCECESVSSCGACDFTDSPIRDRRPPFPECSSEVAVGASCTGEWDICGRSDEMPPEYCVCYANREGALVWDCGNVNCEWCL